MKQTMKRQSSLLAIDPEDYTRRHAMHRKQKSDEPQPDGADKE